MPPAVQVVPVDPVEAKGRSLLTLGPSRILCGSMDSPEYETFLSRFCAVHQEKGGADDFNDIGPPEIEALVSHIKDRYICCKASLPGRDMTH
jgi:hypothetical protein